MLIKFTIPYLFFLRFKMSYTRNGCFFPSFASQMEFYGKQKNTNTQITLRFHAKQISFFLFFGCVLQRLLLLFAYVSRFMKFSIWNTIFVAAQQLSRQRLYVKTAQFSNSLTQRERESDTHTQIPIINDTHTYVNDIGLHKTINNSTH